MSTIFVVSTIIFSTPFLNLGKTYTKPARPSEGIFDERGLTSEVQAYLRQRDLVPRLFFTTVASNDQTHVLHRRYLCRTRLWRICCIYLARVFGITIGGLTSQRP
jgi:hypothetical protein